MPNEFQERFAYDSSGRLEYYGQSEAGTLDRESKWIIEKYEYSGINETSKKYPNGSYANIFMLCLMCMLVLQHYFKSVKLQRWM